MFVNAWLWGKIGFWRMIFAGMGLGLPSWMDRIFLVQGFVWVDVWQSVEWKYFDFVQLRTVCLRILHSQLFDPFRVVLTRQHCWQLIYFLNATAVKRNCQGNWVIRDIYQGTHDFRFIHLFRSVPVITSLVYSYFCKQCNVFRLTVTSTFKVSVLVRGYVICRLNQGGFIYQENHCINLSIKLLCAVTKRTVFFQVVAFQFPTVHKCYIRKCFVMFERLLRMLF